MAALVDPFARGKELVDLRRFGARELDAVLLEETEAWARELDWDFRPSADLVRKYAESRSLGGFALLDGGEVGAYGYTILEDHKGLIGDIFVNAASRGQDSEVRLFRALLDQLIGTPRVSRVESQLMLVEGTVAKALQRERFVRLFERLLMRVDASNDFPPGRNPALRRFHLEPWGDHHYDSAATVISLSYDGHVDAQINDQYRTLAGARQFLYNIVQYPGCGSFYRPGSFVAFDIATGWISGIALTSFVAAEVAHITQLCVTPHARNTGLGYELLRQSVIKLRAAGAQRISLTVTAANTAALDLYERCGFRELRRFHAYVWESY